LGYTLLHIADWLLWIILAASTLYILFFAVVSCLPIFSKPNPSRTGGEVGGANEGVGSSFLILFPAYKEDAVIVSSVQSVLKQDYPKELFHICVISDHMLPETNRQLAQLPLTLLQPTFEKSSKAKALQYAMKAHPLPLSAGRGEDASWVEKPQQGNCTPLYREGQGVGLYVVILDADNVVEPDFLKRLNTVCQQGHQAIQCHRTAKNSNNSIAALDGISEEINNSLFRRGHSRIGLSAGLIGSGMCFDYGLFAKDVTRLSSAVEDRELEGLLARQGVHIHYAEGIMVYDEKVSSCDNFQRQRLRWMSGQVQTLFMMLPYLPKAILRGNVNYVDKTIQQALIPRSLLLLFTPPLAVLFTLVSLFTIHYSPFTIFRWWLLFAAQCLAIFLAIPSRLRQRAMPHALHVPRMAWLMAKNLLRIRLSDKEFHHTTHSMRG